MLPCKKIDFFTFILQLSKQTHTKLTQNSHKTHTKLTQNSHKTHTKLTQNSHKTHTKLTQNSHKTHTKLTQLSMSLSCMIIIDANADEPRFETHYQDLMGTETTILATTDLNVDVVGIITSFLDRSGERVPSIEIGDVKSAIFEETGIDANTIDLITSFFETSDDLSLINSPEMKWRVIEFHETETDYNKPINPFSIPRRSGADGWVVPGTLVTENNIPVRFDHYRRHPRNTVSWTFNPILDHVKLRFLGFPAAAFNYTGGYTSD